MQRVLYRFSTIQQTLPLSQLFFNSNRIRKVTTMCEHVLQRFDNVVKPREDKRDYLGLTLKNQLKVLLISDPETDISAAALSVHVGSMSDPTELQGLAHFLEHMLFMGTKKYPSENEYSKFLSQHGGSSNAYTSDTITNFFFDVAPNYLEQSLDRFAQFFIEPLMLEESVNRELEAVHSEFKKNVDNDSWRLFQICKTMSDENHEFSKFNIGNFETLRNIPNSKGINIRDSLFKFYEKHYSSNTMCLCVLGKEKMEDLVNMVIPMFSPIINHDIKSPRWEKHPYSEKSLMKQLYVVPIKDKRTMNFVFVFPDEVEYYKTAPGHYISHLIGHEGRGSLLSELKEKSLCSNLSSYSESIDGFGFYHICVELTEEALNKTDQIVKLVFQYINMLKTEGPKQYIFEENQRLNFIKFNFMEKSNPIDYVQKLSSLMHYYPMTDVLSSDILFDQYKPDLIAQFLSYLKAENCSIVVLSKSFEGKTDLKEKYYGIDYKIEDMPKELITDIKKSELNPKFKFPEPNEFIPTDFEILNCDSKQSTVPIILKNSEFLRVWYLKDRTYLKPKVYYGIKILNPTVYSSPHNVISNTMFSILFKDALTEFLYDASLAGLSFDINNTTYGFNMEFYGYNHKMDIFLSRVFDKILNFEVCPKRFEILKEKYSRDLKNYKSQPLYQLSNYYLKLVTVEMCWSYEDLIQALGKLTVDSIRNLLKSFFTNFTIEAFFHGNITKESALSVCDLLEKKFIYNFDAIPFPMHSNGKLREVVLEPGCFYRYETVIDIQNPKAINNYFQVCFDNMEDTSKLLLLSQILNEPFFNQLRTIEQLGYIVYSKTRNMSGVMGLNFIIQSEYNTNYLDDRIEAFIMWAEDYISKMSEEEFEAEKNSLITKLLKKQKRMVNFSKKIWFEIENEEYHFKRNELEAEVAKGLNKNQILDFFKKHFSYDSPSRRKLSICIVKSNSAKNEAIPAVSPPDLIKAPTKKESILIKDYAKFTKHKQLYPLPKPKVDISE